jgi:predicted transcriptional regulator
MPAEQPTSIRLPRALKKRLQRAADTEHRRLSVQIVHILTRWAEWWEKQKS